jgi:hypothetical protein
MLTTVACMAMVGVAGADAPASPDNAASAEDAVASDSGNSRGPLPLGLQSYEPSAFGHEKKSDDVGFYNINLSVKFPLMPRFTKDWWGNHDRLYFAFTGVFDFYIGTRDSSPVVGKEYNPQLFWQHQLSCHGDNFEPHKVYGAAHHDAEYPDYPCYFTFGYNHDSNGQNIDSLDQYLHAQQTQGTEAANDAISRGWDYLGFTAKYIFPLTSPKNRVSLYPQAKLFLSDGLLQGEPEELHTWEHPSDAKPRKEVDGLGLLGKFTHQINRGIIGDTKLAVRYGTGYRDPFRYGTVRVEAGVQVLEVPLVFWTQKGYMSDLSQYYRNVTAYGLEIEIGAF